VLLTIHVAVNVCINCSFFTFIIRYGCHAGVCLHTPILDVADLKWRLIAAWPGGLQQHVIDEALAPLSISCFSLEILALKVAIQLRSRSPTSSENKFHEHLSTNGLL